MYSREVDGQVLEFGVSGKLIMNNLVMYDRQTGSLWAQILGQAVEGPLEGTQLEFVPAQLTTWQDWVERHPDTLALEKGYQGIRDPYASYYQSRRAGVMGRLVNDDRLATKEFVLGLQLEGRPVAYPFSELSRTPVVNDLIGGHPVLIWFDPQSALAQAYSRTVEGQVLEFAAGPDGTLLTDLQTSSRWDPLTGRAQSGALEGARLEPLPASQSFWFNWVDFYPNTRLYEGEG